MHGAQADYPVFASFFLTDVRKIGAPYLSKTIRNKPSWTRSIAIAVVLFKHIWMCLIANLFSIKLLNPLLKPQCNPRDE